MGHETSYDGLSVFDVICHEMTPSNYAQRSGRYLTTPLPTLPPAPLPPLPIPGIHFTSASGCSPEYGDLRLTPDMDGVRRAF